MTKSRTQEAAKRRRKKARILWWTKRIALAGLCFGLGSSAGLASSLFYLSTTIPSIGALLEGYNPPQTSRVLASDGTILAELFTERRTVVPLSQIPQVMLDAVISAEDADFFQHEGLDYPGMVRAMWANISSGRISQGASTITQQVARTFFLTREKTYSRKLREILLTKRIEDRLSKEEILFLYLNQIPFGHARYGVQEAAQFYFGKDIFDLDLAEVTLLAGIPKGPSIYSPLKNPEAAARRRKYVLGEMVKLKKISAQEAQVAQDLPIQLASSSRVQSTLAPEAVSLALEEIADIADRKTIQRGRYTIETTIDPVVQKEARRAVLDGLIAIDKRHKRLAPYFTKKSWPNGNRGNSGSLNEGKTYVAEVIGADDNANLVELQLGKRRGFIRVNREKRYNPNGLAPSEFAKNGAKLHVSLLGPLPPNPNDPVRLRLEEGPQSALVAVRVEDGSVAALIGGDQMIMGDFNRATKAARQPGSAFKPMVYLSALRTQKYTAASLLDDSPEVQGDWKPHNSHEEDGFTGTVRLRQALAHSLNLPTIKLIDDIGPQVVADQAQLLGIESPLDPTPALGLGASAITPMEIADSYSTFARGGMRIKPWIVKRIIGPDGIEIPQATREPNPVLSEPEAALITSLLATVIEEGTGRRARRIDRQAAGKTGTSNEQRNAWFVGFTPQITCSVWVGYDDRRSIGRKEHGSRAALPIWLDFMKSIHKELPKIDFQYPEEGLITVDIDPETGLLAYEGMENPLAEIFLQGTEPTQTAIPPDLIAPTDFLMDQLAAPQGGSQPVDAGVDREPSDTP